MFRAKPVRRTSSLIGTPRTKCSRRSSAHCSTSSTPPPGPRSTRTRPGSRSPRTPPPPSRGVKSQPAKGGQFLTGADIQRTTADLDSLFPGRYLNVTSFKRDGTGVATPVWFVSDGSRLLAFTDLQSAKIRRIRRNPHILVASCRPWGKLRREPIGASAEVLTETADLERVRKLLLARYRISYRVVLLFYRLGRRLRGKQSVADGAALAITVE
ncbi:MAG: PPOX class F420-dependent oxidoreductase [Solirubrobacteraceae bacterium]